MGLDFLKRVQSATLVVGVLAFLFVSLYYNIDFGFGVLVGCLWSIANFWALRLVLTAFIRPGQADYTRTLIFAAIKFPLLYAIGFVVLWKGWFEPLSLLVGFSLLFLVIVLKAGGRIVMKMDRIGTSREAHHSL